MCMGNRVVKIWEVDRGLEKGAMGERGKWEISIIFSTIKIH